MQATHPATVAVRTAASAAAARGEQPHAARPSAEGRQPCGCSGRTTQQGLALQETAAAGMQAPCARCSAVDWREPSVHTAGGPPDGPNAAAQCMHACVPAGRQCIAICRQHLASTRMAPRATRSRATRRQKPCAPRQRGRPESRGLQRGTEQSASATVGLECSRAAAAALLHGSLTACLKRVHSDPISHQAPTVYCRCHVVIEVLLLLLLLLTCTHSPSPVVFS